MTAHIASKTYANVALESSVQGADPHKLIALLYQGAMQAIVNARSSILRKDLEGKLKAINHAIRIIGEGLRGSLDKNVGGKLALDLDALYDYMCRRLVVANANDDIEILDEVTRLLSELKGAWDSIRPALTASAPAINASTPAAVLPSQQQPAMKKAQPLVYGRG